MIILALDTTENTATAAILDGNDLLASETLCLTRTHSETMLPILSELLTRCAKNFEDVDLFACSAGPGSFTGVRISAAVIKGLAFGRNKPCIGVSALEALAENLRGVDGIVCPGMDARRGQLYNALFESKADGTLTRLTEDRTVSAANLLKELKEKHSDKPIYLCGGGYDIMKETFEGTLPIAFTPSALIPESALSVGLTALRHFDADPTSASDDRTIEPTYLRPSQAERNRKQ